MNSFDCGVFASHNIFILPILYIFFVIASMHYIESLEGSGILTRYVILLKLVCGIIIPLLLPPKDTYGAIKKNYGRRTHQWMPDVRNVFIVMNYANKKRLQQTTNTAG